MSKAGQGSVSPLFEALEHRQLLSAGQLDSTFGNDGMVVTNQGLGGAAGIAVEVDGKLVVGARGDSYQGFNLVRYNEDGSVDTSFGDHGVLSGLHDDQLSSMVVQSDGKIVLAGLRTESTSTSLQMFTALARYDTDGSLDETFGDGGVVEFPGDRYVFSSGTSFGSLSPGVVRLAAQADGKLLLTQVLGDQSAAGPTLNVFRLTDSGALDDSFGDHGRAVFQLGMATIPDDMAVQADGKIVIAIDGSQVNRTGGSWSLSNTRGYLLRLNSDGSRDAGFGNSGLVTESAASGQVYLKKVAIGLDGKLLVMGENMLPSRDVTSFLIRYNTDGTRDDSFGDQGKIVLKPGGGGSYADLLVQPDGKILLSGETSGPTGKPGFLSQRLNVDGTADETFGDSGTTAVNVGNQFDYGGSMALQADGSVVIVGFSSKSRPSDTSDDTSDVALIRLQGDRGSAGSAHASLRRGKDQQAPYLGKNKEAAKHHRSPKRIAMEQAALLAANASHRSPKRIAMELAAELAAGHRSPKRIAMDLAALEAAGNDA